MEKNVVYIYIANGTYARYLCLHGRDFFSRMDIYMDHIPKDKKNLQEKYPGIEIDSLFGTPYPFSKLRSITGVPTRLFGGSRKIAKLHAKNAAEIHIRLQSWQSTGY